MDLTNAPLDAEGYPTKPSCAIALFDSDAIKRNEVRMPLEIFSIIKNLGEEFHLHYTAQFDLFGHTFFETIHCKGLHAELIFLKEKTNNRLVHTQLENFLRLVSECIDRKNYKLLVNAD